MVSKAEQDIQKRMYDKVGKEAYENEIEKLKNRDMKSGGKKR